LDEKELADVRARRSVGTEDDCWHEVPTAEYSREVRLELYKLALRLTSKPESNVFEEVVIDGIRFHLRVWPLLRD
jgi:hypothetical protein